MSRGKLATAACAAALPFGAPARRDGPSRHQASQRRAGQHLLLSASVVALSVAMAPAAEAIQARCVNSLIDSTVNGQKFALKGNWGSFEGSNALGFTAKGLLAENLFGSRSQLTMSGGLGFGLDGDTVGGRVSTQIGW